MLNRPHLQGPAIEISLGDFLCFTNEHITWLEPA